MSDRLVQIPKNTIKVGKRVPFPVYDKDENLLVQKGVELTETQALILQKYDRFFTPDKELITALVSVDNKAGLQTEVELEEENASAYKMPTPFVRLKQLEADLQCVINGRLNSTDFSATLYRLADRLHVLTKDTPDCILATIFLDKQSPDPVKKSLNVAIICDLIAEALQYNEKDRRALVAAALTMDMGFIYSRANMDNHATFSQRLLSELGVTDCQWLEFVAKHHENNDGSGLPEGLTCDHISLGAAILSLVVAYCDQFTGKYVSAKKSQSRALHDFFQDNDPRYKGALKNLLLRVVGCYSPGKVVILKNKEIGVVLRRGTRPDAVQIRYFPSPKGDKNKVGQVCNVDNKINPVVEVISPEKLPLDVDFENLWGYGEKK